MHDNFVFDIYRFQTPRVWGEAGGYGTRLPNQQFQTPRVWGEDRLLSPVYQGLISDPTRVGRGSTGRCAGIAPNFQTPRVWGEATSDASNPRCPILSDPTRVGRGADNYEWSVDVLVSDPTRVGRGTGAGLSVSPEALSDPTRVGRGIGNDV